jgi:hypothetical protein
VQAVQCHLAMHGLSVLPLHYRFKHDEKDWRNPLFGKSRLYATGPKLQLHLIIASSSSCELRRIVKKWGESQQMPKKAWREKKTVEI